MDCKKESMNELIIKKQKHREALRQEYIKFLDSPYKDDHLLDPAIQRYSAMRETMGKHFRPSPRTSFFGMVALVIPCAAIFYVFYWDITTREKKIRAGEVAYKDRLFKFV